MFSFNPKIKEEKQYLIHNLYLFNKYSTMVLPGDNKVFDKRVDEVSGLPIFRMMNMKMSEGKSSLSQNSAYNDEKFRAIVRNFKPNLKADSPEEVINAHQVFFDYMQNLPCTICFIFDFVNFRYLLISKSIKKILGIEEEEFLTKGIAQFLAYLHPDDASQISHIHKEMFGYIHKNNAIEIAKLRFDFNFRIRNKQGLYIQMLQQTIITSVDEDNQPLYDFSTCTDITRQKNNNRMELNVYRKEEDVYELVYNYTVPSKIGFGLSAAEFRVLKFGSEGKTSRQIAAIISRSEHTINNQKRNILSKTNSASLSEAIQKVGLILIAATSYYLMSFKV